jgi:hypothetical protein
VDSDESGGNPGFLIAMLAVCQFKSSLAQSRRPRLARFLPSACSTHCATR